MPTHKNSRLDIWNDAAEVTKLYNNRWRVAIRCKPSNKVEDWYYANRGTSFAEFADNYDQQLDIDGETEGWEPSEGEAWLDALLIRQEMGYTPSGEYVVTFVYETLTESYVEDREEEVDYELNGLRRVTRTLIAKEGTTYGKEVGSDTISHTALGYGTETLTLGIVDSVPLGDDEGGYTRIREVWLEPGILNVEEIRNSGADRVVVSALALSAGEVQSQLSEVTSNHVYISQSTLNYEGIPTNQFVYEVDDFEVIDRELNGLKRITRREYSATNFIEGDVGTDTYSDLTLATESIDNDAQIKVRKTVWVEQGVLTETISPESTGLNRASRTYLVSAPVATNPVVSETTQNVEGLQTITRITLERSDGGDITDGTPTNSFGRMFNFTYPGIVGVSSVTATAISGDTAINRFFYQQSPVERPIPATSYVFFQTESQPVAGDYIYDGAEGLWSPSEWAGGIYYGWRYQRDNFGTPIGERPGFRGFRTVEDDNEIDDVVLSLSGTATDDDGLSGTLLLGGTTYAISVSGGPDKPDGNKYTLGLIDIQPAFIDIDGVQYYKKIITVATIPAQGGSVIT